MVLVCVIFDEVPGARFVDHHHGGEIRDARRLLHVVGDDDDGVILFEFLHQFLDLEGGDRVEGGGGFVHQDDFRLDRQGTGDAQALLLPAGEGQAGLVEFILHLIPQGGRLQAVFHDPIQVRLAVDAIQARPIGHVIENGLGERVGALEDHPDPPAHIDHIHAGQEHVLPIQADLHLPCGSRGSGRSCG